MTQSNPKANKARGATFERDIAKRLGGRRHLADTGGPEDVEHELLCIQVKSGGQVVTQALRDGMASAKAAQATCPGKIAAVALVDRRGTRLARYLVFDLDQWANFHGYPKCEEVSE